MKEMTAAVKHDDDDVVFERIHHQRYDHHSHLTKKKENVERKEKETDTKRERSENTDKRVIKRIN
jgi:hypothetical protein